MSGIGQIAKLGAKGVDYLVDALRSARPVMAQADDVAKVAAKPEPWQMTPSKWREANFNEDVHRYLPSDYFGDISLNTPIEQFQSVLKNVKGNEFRANKYGDIGVFNKGKQVGYADNAAVVVDPLMQGQGIGVELVRELRKANPDYVFGNQTPAGTNLMYSFHKNEVQNAIKSGKQVPKEVLEFYPEFRK
jgi:GNAT superfamily N-acetyltransferase